MRIPIGLSVIATAIATAASSAQTSANVGDVLARVGGRIADYYKRAQSVICLERHVVQPIGSNWGPDGLARMTESELRVETEATDGDGPGEAKVLRQLLKVNGRPPRERDRKDRAGCTDPNPISTEPLAFLLPARRSEYTFVSGGVGKGKDRNTLVIDFTSSKPEGRAELRDDPRGHEDCVQWSLPIATKGRVWVDATTFDVVRIEERLAGIADISVPVKMQRKQNLGTTVVIERHDTTIRYKTVAFQEPDEVMLLPESIETVIVARGGLQSVRTHQTFTGYRRFVTGARLVK